jgi:nicotinamide riboside kinase
MTELAHLLAPLNVVLFTFGNDQVTVAELLGFVTGAASVWLTVLARVSNFPVGIANSAFFLVLFLSARLYADSGLQVVYIVLGFAGWWQWLHGGQARTRLTVARSGWQLLAACVVFAVAATWGSRGGVWARTQCVTEYGRDYTEIKWRRARDAARAAGLPEPPLDDLEWTHSDFGAVAAEQTRRENQAAGSGSPLLVCDTDAFATSVWERRYLGDRARGPQPWATSELPRRDVYLLTSHEGVPWEDDGLREGDLAVRAAMTGWFAVALTGAGHSWVLLTGSPGERLTLAVRVTESVLEHRVTFGPPIDARSLR